MQRRLLCLLLPLTAMLGGCGGASDDAGPKPTPMPPTLAGTYAGQFPCSNCAAIAATLWLRPDGRFFLRQQFTDGEAADEVAASGPSATYSLGRWTWDEIAAEAVLRSAGPERRLIVVDADRLQLHVASPTEHALTRDTTVPPFGDRLALDGESTVTERGATFRECLTGLELVVSESGLYRELRRQHRRMNPKGRVALTTIEGHLVTVTRGSTTSEQLVVDRFVTMKPGTPCPAGRG
ncbi:MAG TPA: copper resistance protein NlpE N-terminal domain-containing protein [Gammaproteobacteria bacterium]